MILFSDLCDGKSFELYAKCQGGLHDILVILKLRLVRFFELLFRVFVCVVWRSVYRSEVKGHCGPSWFLGTGGENI